MYGISKNKMYDNNSANSKEKFKTLLQGSDTI